ncbi:MAG TPA: hypothetical protein VF053_11740 [Streptosporangiales bacterium]
MTASGELRRHGPDAAEEAVLVHLSVADFVTATPDTYDSGEPPLDPDPYGDYVVPRLRARRRRRLRTALVAACAAVALGLAYVFGGAHPAHDPPASGDVRSWPTRGSLAHDRDFVAGLARRAAHGQVIYAGDVGGTRVGLVVSPYPSVSALGLTAFVGRKGASAERMNETDPGLVPPTARVVAWADPGPQGAHVLVVLADSRARTVGVSDRPLPRVGHIDRSYVTYRLHNGVAAVRARAPSVRMMRISVEGMPGSPYDGAVLGIERSPYTPGFPAPRPRRSYGTVTGIDRAWQDAAGEVASTYRVPFDRLVVLWRWAHRSGDRTALLAAAYRLPGGAVVLQVRRRSRQIDDSVAVDHYVEGRPLLDPAEPVAWAMGDRIGVFWPGRAHHAVVLNGSLRSFPEQVVTRTDADGFAAFTVPPRMRDPWVQIPLGRGNVNGYILSTTSPYDLDPLDAGTGAVPPVAP